MLEAWNSHEADRVLALMTDDIEYRDDGWQTMRGHADGCEFMDATSRATPDMTLELLAGPHVIPGEPRAALHWRGWGMHTGRLDPPGFAPTNRRWELVGVDFREYRDERVCKLRIAYDMMTASRQLGLMPQAGSRAERALAMAQRSASRVFSGRFADGTAAELAPGGSNNRAAAASSTWVRRVATPRRATL